MHYYDFFRNSPGKIAEQWQDQGMFLATVDLVGEKDSDPARTHSLTSLVV